VVGRESLQYIFTLKYLISCPDYSLRVWESTNEEFGELTRSCPIRESLQGTAFQMIWLEAQFFGDMLKKGTGWMNGILVSSSLEASLRDSGKDTIIRFATRSSDTVNKIYLAPQV